nr:MAG TPA: hypothetical protein [Caudoviricetes sp.]
MAVRIGMSRKEFLRSTLKDLRIRIEQYGISKNEEIQSQLINMDYQSWLTGLYMKASISCVLFPRNASYPSKPITQEKQNNWVEHNPDTPKKSEAELRQEERYYELLIRQANANISEIGNKKGKQDE